MIAKAIKELDQNISKPGKTVDSMKDLNSFGGTFDGLSALDYSKFIDFLNAAAKEINPVDPESVTLSIYEAPFLPMSWIDQKVPNSWDAEVIEGSNDVEDTLTAGNGSQTLMGLMLDDILIGGSGSDFLVGGEGADTFQFNSVDDSRPGGKRDVITDFNGEEGDRIDLSNIQTAIKFIGSAEFSGSPGEVRFDAGILQLNTDREQNSDMEIELAGMQSFSSDYLLLALH